MKRRSNPRLHECVDPVRYLGIVTPLLIIVTPTKVLIAFLMPNFRIYDPLLLNNLLLLSIVLDFCHTDSVH